MPTGQTQHTITLYVHGSLVESVHPGDRVSVTGIYRANPVRINPIQRAVHSIYRTSIDVIHFRKLSHDRLHEVANGLVCQLVFTKIINESILQSFHDRGTHRKSVGIVPIRRCY